MYIDLSDVPAGVYGRGLWRPMVSPPETMVVGLLFEVFVAEWQSRRSGPIPKIEPFDWEINDPGAMTPPKRSRPPREFRPTTSSPAEPEPTSTPRSSQLQNHCAATQVADYLNLKVKTLYNWRTQHEGSPSMLVGGVPRWERSVVDRWIAE